MPSVLNVCWLVTAWFIAPRISSDPGVQAYVMAVCVLVGGVLQWLVQWPALRRLGFRFELDFAASRQALWRVARGMVPDDVRFGRLANQHAAGQSARPRFVGRPRRAGPDRLAGRRALSDGSRARRRPSGMASGFINSRSGLLGIAVATVIFPLLSRHAAQRRLCAGWAAI